MIRTASSRTQRLAVPLLALSLLLTACSSGPGEPDPDASSTPGASETPDVAVVVGPKECVLGSWKIDNPTFEKYINSATGAASGIPAGIDTSVAISGDSYLRFDDKGNYFGWRDDFTLTMGTSAMPVTHVSNSAEMGDYGVVLGFGDKVKNDFLWVAESMSILRDEVFTVGGIAQVVDDGGATVQMNLFEGYHGEVPRIEEHESVEGTGPFRCDGDVLKFELDTGMQMLYHRSTVTRD